jgi:aspartyl-tRNA(Asn)/glutamyl-tRNA(Gln) amidotransferase subunit C
VPAATEADRKPVSLDSQTIRAICQLARLRVADDQVDAIARELSGILGWAMRLTLRADRVSDGGDREAILANAPGAVEDCFAVPKVVE